MEYKEFRFASSKQIRISRAKVSSLRTKPTSISLPPASHDFPVYLAVWNGFLEHSMLLKSTVLPSMVNSVPDSHTADTVASNLVDPADSVPPGHEIMTVSPAFRDIEVASGSA